MRDLIMEEILQGTFKEQLRNRARKASVVPSASRYPHTAKRAALERGRQPWSNPPETTSTSEQRPSHPSYL